MTEEQIQGKLFWVRKKREIRINQVRITGVDRLYPCLPMESMKMMETFAFALLKTKSKS